MPSLPTLPTAPATLTAVTHTYLQEVADWLNFVANPPMFLGSVTTTFTVTTAGSGVTIPLDTEEIDTAGGHDNVTNKTRYTAQYPGRYLCIVSAVFPSTAGGRRGAWLILNGTTTYTDAGNTLAPATGVARVQSSRLIYMNGTGDYVEGIAFQDSGGSITGCTGTLQVIWIGSS
jgi:hypothetical protein